VVFEKEESTAGQISIELNKLFAPKCAAAVLVQIQSLFNVIVVGRMADPTILAGMGLATSIILIIVISINYGICGAQDQFTSREFGAGNLQKCGVYLNRGRLVLTAFFIPLYAITWFTISPLIKLMTDDDQIVYWGVYYTKWSVVYVFFFL